MRSVVAFLLVVSSVAMGQVVPPGPGFVRFAGLGPFGGPANGDEGPAINARLSNTTAITFDTRGNLYIAEFLENRVRRITPDGKINTVAGTGRAGFSGDGGPATAGQLNRPTGLAVDSAGNLYISDSWNYRIRRVSNGVLGTVAGDGRYYSAGDGGPAQVASLAPSQIAVDSRNNLYIIDEGPPSVSFPDSSHFPDGLRVRKIDSRGVITTVAGGQSGFSGDGGPATAAQIIAGAIATDSSGSFYIMGGGRIRKVAADGIISTFAIGAAEFNQFVSGAMAVAPDRSVYVADPSDARVWKIKADGSMEVFAGSNLPEFRDGCDSSGTPFPKFAKNAYILPGAIALDGAGSVYIGDNFNLHLDKITPDGLIAAIAGLGPAHFSGDGGPALAARLSAPTALATDAFGNLFISDSQNNRVRRVSPDGMIQTVAGGGPTSTDSPSCFARSDSYLSRPDGLALDSKGNLYIADTDHFRIRKVAPDGTSTTIAGTGQQTGKKGNNGDGGPAAAATFLFPHSVAVDRGGNILVVDNAYIREITPDGNIKTLPTKTFANGVTIDTEGSIYYSSLGVYKIMPSGESVIVMSATNFARSLAVSPDGTLVAVAGYSSLSLLRMSPSCVTDTLADQEFGGLAYDAQGNLYVSDGRNSVVWQLPAKSALPAPPGPMPMVDEFGVLNATSLWPQTNSNGFPILSPIAPGEILTVRGICMGPLSLLSAQVDSSGTLSSQLGDTGVTFDGVPAPLLSVQNGQIELVAPFELIPQNSTNMTVTYKGHSVTKPLDVLDSVPGLFSADGSGRGQAAAVNADGTLNSKDNPAARGSIISLYGTGLGQTDPPGVDGRPPAGLAKSRNIFPVQFIDITPTQVFEPPVFTGAAPGFPGLSQINVVIPTRLRPTLVLVALGHAFAQVFIYVK